MKKSVFSKAATALLAMLVLICMAVQPAWAGHRKVQRRVVPVYPEMAKRMNIRGTVCVDIKIAPDGHVTEVHAVRGNGLLAPAAETAVKKWKFAPEEHPSRETVAIEFKLKGLAISQEDASEMAAAWLPLPR